MDELKLFLEDVAAESRKDLDRVEAQINEEQTAMETDAASKAAEKAALWLRGETEKLQNDAALAVAAKQSENRRELLARREQYAEEVFAAVRERIAAFTASAEYPAHLKTLLDEAKAALASETGETVLRLRREDIALGERLVGRNSAMRVQEGDFALGGLQLSVGSRRADLSFDTALRELRGRFASVSGLEMGT